MNMNEPKGVFVCLLAVLAAAVGAGCASTAHLRDAEPQFHAGDYAGARAGARAALDKEEDAEKRESAAYILDNLDVGSSSLMLGTSEEAARFPSPPLRVSFGEGRFLACKFQTPGERST